MEIVLLGIHLVLSSFSSGELSHKDVGEDLFCVTKERLWDMWKQKLEGLQLISWLGPGAKRPLA